MLMRSLHSGPLLKTGDVIIRKMRDEASDYRLMAKWLTDDRVLEFYEGRDQPHSYETVVKKYRPRVVGESPVQPCILVYKRREAGYLQYYPVLEPQEYGLEEALGTYGIDLFVGDSRYWGQGVGTRALTALVAYLFEEFGAKRIVIDPHVDNLRAIRAYEKAGFRKVKVLPEHELHEGVRRDCWLMAIERPQSSASAATGRRRRATP
jgi:aminoglycoside 6'-N-acetyltransferase